MKLDYNLIQRMQGLLMMLHKAGAKEAAVAGGAIRDMILNKPIKDIDVFYSGKLNEKEMFYKTGESESNNPYSELEDFRLTHPHIEVEGIPYPIQLLKVDGSLFDHIKEFPVGLSKVWLTWSGIGLSTDFLKDASLELLSFSEDCSEEYMEKIQEKYPEYL